MSAAPTAPQDLRIIWDIAARLNVASHMTVIIHSMHQWCTDTAVRTMHKMHQIAQATPAAPPRHTMASA